MGRPSRGKTSFQRRKKGLMKKALEFSTLCGVDTCVIVLGPGEASIETWPENSDEVLRIINRFRSQAESGKEKENRILDRLNQLSSVVDSQIQIVKGKMDILRTKQSVGGFAYDGPSSLPPFLEHGSTSLPAVQASLPAHGLSVLEHGPSSSLPAISALEHGPSSSLTAISALEHGPSFLPVSFLEPLPFLEHDVSFMEHGPYAVSFLKHSPASFPVEHGPSSLPVVSALEHGQSFFPGSFLEPSHSAAASFLEHGVSFLEHGSSSLASVSFLEPGPMEFPTDSRPEDLMFFSCGCGCDSLELAAASEDASAFAHHAALGLKPHTKHSVQFLEASNQMKNVVRSSGWFFPEGSRALHSDPADAFPHMLS